MCWRQCPHRKRLKYDVGLSPVATSLRVTALGSERVPIFPELLAACDEGLDFWVVGVGVLLLLFAFGGAFGAGDDLAGFFSECVGYFFELGEVEG